MTHWIELFAALSLAIFGVLILTSEPDDYTDTHWSDWRNDGDPPPPPE